MKRILHLIYLFSVVILMIPATGYAIHPEWLKEDPKKKKNKKREIQFSYRADCAPARSEIDMSINNVRARLLAGGDVWWNLTDGKYIVAKVERGSGLTEVSSIFAGAVWLGGYDLAGNLKLGAERYSASAVTDFCGGTVD